MIWEKIIGQSEAIDVLHRSAASGRLAHALLFVGPPGVGKGLAARTLATALLCERVPESELDACGECPSCRMMQAGTHPDFLSVACPEGKSELPIELLVGSRENRGGEGLCHDLSLRPMAGRRRVALIDDADRMSNESANALLKTLEEPPPYAVIVLIAADSSKILPTIRSRCQTVRFGPLDPSQVARLVTELEWAGRSPRSPSGRRVIRRQPGSGAAAFESGAAHAPGGPVRRSQPARVSTVYHCSDRPWCIGRHRGRYPAATGQRAMGRPLSCRFLPRRACASGVRVRSLGRSLPTVPPPAYRTSLRRRTSSEGCRPESPRWPS